MWAVSITECGSGNFAANVKQFGVKSESPRCHNGVTHRVTTGRCSLDRLEGGSKVKLNIGILHFWINNLKRARPQDVGVSNICRKRFSNIDRMQYVALITTY
jgi:hypothetical protein